MDNVFRELCADRFRNSLLYLWIFAGPEVSSAIQMGRSPVFKTTGVIFWSISMCLKYLYNFRGRIIRLHWDVLHGKAECSEIEVLFCDNIEQI